MRPSSPDQTRLTKRRVELLDRGVAMCCWESKAENDKFLNFHAHRQQYLQQYLQLDYIWYTYRGRRKKANQTSRISVSYLFAPYVTH